MKKSAIVVGGTGMLREVTLWLSRQGYRVFVIGRNERKLKNVVNEGQPGTIIPVAVDYHDDNGFFRKIDEVKRVNGPVELVVSWIHSSAPRAFDILNDVVNDKADDTWRLFHVRGSSAALSNTPIHVPEHCRYRQVVLGFIIENGQSRWLSHQEISGGVIKAIKQDLKDSVVGKVEPWEQRP